VILENRLWGGAGKLHEIDHCKGDFCSSPTPFLHTEKPLIAKIKYTR
jgi:hypothetical protein